MADWQERIAREKEEFDEKVVKLTSFLFSEKSKPLSDKERELMTEQLLMMQRYSEVLRRRVELFWSERPHFTEFMDGEEW